MSAGSGPLPSRLDELLADRALLGLDPGEAVELNELLAATPAADSEGFELAAAALQVALLEDDGEPLPAALRSRVEADARRELAAAPRPRRSAPPASRRWLLGMGERLAWLAAAALLLFALLPSRVPGPAEQRARLLEAGGARTLAWTATDDPAAARASGDVVWDNARQEGYMRFRGLAVNDPAREQYQLWIFDAARDEARPVDGGVFDVDSTTGDVIVPIRAKLAISEPTLFAVTIERPGGVVVSSRERLPLLAKVGG